MDSGITLWTGYHTMDSDITLQTAVSHYGQRYHTTDSGITLWTVISHYGQ